MNKYNKLMEIKKSFINEYGRFWVKKSEQNDPVSQFA